MIRLALLIGIPVLLPTVLYLLWLGRARNKAMAAGVPDEELPRFGDAPWPALIGGGVVLMALVLGASRLMTQQGDPHDVYIPAQLIDGKVVPGKIEHKAD